MNLLNIAGKPPITVSPEESALHAVEVMANNSIGAVAVVENDELVGIFTERDVVIRFVHKKHSAPDITVREVMTPEPLVAPIEMEIKKALEFMTENHFRHLPVVDGDGKIQGMLSIRDVMNRAVEFFSHTI